MMYGPKLLNLILMINKSEDMRMHIDSVNAYVVDMLKRLKEFQEHEESIEIKISILQFGGNVIWVHRLEKVSDVEFLADGYCHGISNYDEAFEFLNQHLTKDDLMIHSGKIAPPSIIMFTHGKDILDVRGRNALEVLNQNAWFSNATRSLIYVHDCEKNFVYDNFSSFVTCIDDICEIDTKFMINCITIGPSKNNDSPMTIARKEMNYGNIVEKMNFDDPFADTSVCDNIFNSTLSLFNNYTPFE